MSALPEFILDFAVTVDATDREQARDIAASIRRDLAATAKHVNLCHLEEVPPYPELPPPMSDVHRRAA